MLTPFASPALHTASPPKPPGTGRGGGGGGGGAGGGAGADGGHIESVAEAIAELARRKGRTPPAAGTGGGGGGGGGKGAAPRASPGNANPAAAAVGPLLAGLNAQHKGFAGVDMRLTKAQLRDTMMGLLQVTTYSNTHNVSCEC